MQMEMSAHKIQTSGNHPKERIQQSTLPDVTTPPLLAVRFGAMYYCIPYIYCPGFVFYIAL